MTTDFVEKTHKDYLFRAGAHTTPHSGRTLYQHLEGVQKLLHDWGNEAAVSTAGLFHSVYGTSAFKISIISLDQREEVRALIGDETEELVYLFCVCERHACLTPLLYGTMKMKNMDTGEQIPLTEKTQRQLLELEVANFVDHFPENKIESPGNKAELLLKTYIMTTEKYLSKGAYSAIKLIYSNTYSAQPMAETGSGEQRNSESTYSKTKGT